MNDTKCNIRLPVSLIILSAGSGTRFSSRVKKHWLRIDETPLWLFVTQRIKKMCHFEKIVITASQEDAPLMRHYTDIEVVTGGETRHESLLNGLEKVSTPYVLVHDAARACVSQALLMRLIDTIEDADVAVPALPIDDTCYFEDKPIDRSKLRRIQTPQLSKTDRLKTALTKTKNFSDESSAIASTGGKVTFVEGESCNLKLTRPDDLKYLECLAPPSTRTVSGFGFDTHPFIEGKEMKLCGVSIDDPRGFRAHSDGDVAIHALIDALLGAAGIGDIGIHFPDTDERFAQANSLKLLQSIVKRIESIGFELHHVDLTIVAQSPKLTPYKTLMRSTLSKTLGLPLQHVSIKATTSEGLGFIGRNEGISVHAYATLGYHQWKSPKEGN